MLLASNHMFPTGSIEVVLERLAKAGAGGLDIFLPHIQFVNTPNFGPENLKRCREAAEAVGLPIVSMIGCAAPPNLGFGNYLGPDPDRGRAEAIAFIKHNVQLCKALGATHFNSAEGRLPDGADEKAIWDRLVRTLKEAAPILEAGGVTFDIELHPGLIASTPEKAPRLIKEVGSKNVGVCLDFCHANVITKGDPVGMIQALKGTVTCVHISDGIQVSGLHLPVGKGEIDVDACIKAVKETGFNGIWDLCMYGCAFPELSLKTSVKFLKKEHPDILKK